MGIYFLTYEDETGYYTNHIKNLNDSLKKYSPIVEIETFTKSNIDKDFKTTYNNILQQNRGGGYWLWKPYIILNKLRRLNQNDILIYMDSTYMFINDISPLLEELITKENKDMLIFSNKPREPTFLLKNWCKMDVIKKYGMFEKAFQENSVDCWGGFMILKKTDKTMKIMDEWFTMCCDYDNITDSISKEPNTSDFKDHRHDQSLLTIACIKNNIEFRWLDDKIFYNLKTYH